MPVRIWRAHIQARGGLPPGGVSVASTRSMYFHSSISRASLRSSAALSKPTLPISRRYIRTGSSMMSTFSRRLTHSLSMSGSSDSSSSS